LSIKTIDDVYFDPSDKGTAIQLSSDKLTINATGIGVARLNTPLIQKGKVYFEMLANAPNAAFGVTRKTDTLNANFWTSPTSLYYGGDGRIWGGGILLSSSVPTYTTGDIISLLLDYDNMRFVFLKNNSLVFERSILTDDLLFDYYGTLGCYSTSTSATIRLKRDDMSYYVRGYKPYYYNEDKMVIKNRTTNQIYSLDNKTLIHLPSASDKNMNSYGIEAGQEIRLDEPFDKIKLIKDTSSALGEGKTFTHTIDLSEWTARKILL